MGLGWHVVLERAIPTIDVASTDGKALIHHQHELDELAAKLGIAALTSFVSVNAERVAGYLQEQGLDPNDFPIPDEEWFDAAGGLQTVRGLIEHLRATPQAVSNGGRILRDLQAIEAILTAAEREQVQFHLASDLPK